MHAAGPKSRGVGYRGASIILYILYIGTATAATAILLYISKPTIYRLNGGGRQGYIVTQYVSTYSCLCVWKIFHYILQICER